MLDLDTVIKMLQDRKITFVAKETGLSYQTIWRVARGDVRSVNYETIKKLSDYFRKSKI